MTSQVQRPVSGAAAGALGLLVVGLALLGFGGFVQFDNTSRAGVPEWVLPLAPLAVAAGIAAVVIAWRDRVARLWYGGALIVLLVFVNWQSATNDGFIFIWESDVFETAAFQVTVGLVALVLLATGLQPAKRPGAPSAGRVGAGRWLVRAAAYLCGTVIVVFVATWEGIEYYTPADCDDCLDGFKGLYWGTAALIACLVSVVVIELVLRSRRKQERMEGIRA